MHDTKNNIATERPRVYITWLVVAYVMAGLWYFGWRLTTLNHGALLLSISLYGAELFGFISGLLFILMTYRLSVRHAPPPKPGITVDVFVPTYNESVDLVRRTLIAAHRIEYPHVTWLLDDGRREEMRKLAEEIGCRYLTRSDNLHAKAGNLNHALGYSQGDFIAIFDADHAPRKDFLDKVLGFFADDKLAFVQTPQDFYNIDSFNHRQSRKRVWDEQALFFKVIQRGKDASNAAFFCGSCAVIRRSALEEIGGFATETVTEDVHTAVRLHKRGWRSAYYPESLAFGLAPHSIDSYLSQRVRWGLGAMQVLRLENTLFCRGLTFAQRMNYLASALFFFEGWQKLVFFLTPPMVFFEGAMPIIAPIGQFAIYFCAYYLLSLLMHLELGRGYNAVLLSEQYAMTRFFAFISTSLGLFRRNVRFVVTDKALSKSGKAWLWLSPLVSIGIVTLVSLPVGVWRIMEGTIQWDAGLATMAWALITLGSAAVITVFTLRHAGNRRAEYRFPLHVPVVLTVDSRFYLGLTSDLSPGGALYVGEVPPALVRDQHVAVAIHLPNLVVRDKAVATFVRHAGQAGAKGKQESAIGLHFLWEVEANTGALETFLFGNRLQIDMERIEEVASPPLTRLADALRQGGGRQSVAYRWMAGLLLVPQESAGLPVAIAHVDDAAPLLFSSVPIDAAGAAILRQQAAGAPSERAVSLTPSGTLPTPTGDFHLYNVTSHAAHPSASDQTRTTS